MQTRNDNNGNVTYQYNNPAHKHAVSQIGSLFYCYDANRNMTRRNATSSACTNGDTLVYDQENRLTSITVGGTTTTYTYDGDGNRVKKVAGSTATYYVGNYFEVTNGVSTKYYYFGKQRVAMRTNTGVLYLHSDHLGSTSITTNSAGACTSAQWYYAYGNVRTPAPTTPCSGALPTDYTFTGQRRDASAGLMYYGARYYDPTLGRFVSADTLVPSAGNPQSLNRYAYVLNNPVKYADPTGHWSEEELEDKFGTDWRDQYFGKDSVFEGRDALLKYLLSDQVHDPFSLEIIRQFFEPARALHSLKLSFAGIDAIGARVVVSGGTGVFAGASVDAVLNLTAGQFSVFGSPALGGQIGESATVVGGITLIKNMRSNDDFRGVFEAVGIQGGRLAGVTVEGFWSGPMSDRYNPTDKTWGGFLGGGLGIGLGVYGEMSYSFEGYREDVQGSHWLPYIPNALDVVSEILTAWHHDIIANPYLNPAWSWSPYR